MASTQSVQPQRLMYLAAKKASIHLLNSAHLHEIALKLPPEVWNYVLSLLSPPQLIHLEHTAYLQAEARGTDKSEPCFQTEDLWQQSCANTGGVYTCID